MRLPRFGPLGWGGVDGESDAQRRTSFQHGHRASWWAFEAALDRPELPLPECCGDVTVPLQSVRIQGPLACN